MKKILPIAAAAVPPCVQRSPAPLVSPLSQAGGAPGGGCRTRSLVMRLPVQYRTAAACAAVATACWLAPAPAAAPRGRAASAGTTAAIASVATIATIRFLNVALIGTGMLPDTESDRTVTRRSRPAATSTARVRTA